MTGFHLLTDAEALRLSEAGAVAIDPAGRSLLNKILALWVTAEDENRRQKRVQTLATNVAAQVVSLEEMILDDSLDAQELRSRIRRTIQLESPDIFEVILDHSRTLNVALARVIGSRTGRGGPKHDWMVPYLSAVLAAYHRVGGDNKLPSNGDDHLVADKPAYKFVNCFNQILLDRFGSDRDTATAISSLAGKRGANLTQFLRRCLQEFEEFPFGFRERTLLLLTEGVQSEFRSLFATPIGDTSAASPIEEWNNQARHMYEKRRPSRLTAPPGDPDAE